MSEKLVSFTTQAVSNELTLAEVKEKIKALPTDQLAKGYAALKPFEKTVEEIVKTARDSLMERFPNEKTSTDAKGHWYIEGEGPKLQARLSNKFVINEERATEVLKAKNLLEQASDHRLNATDVEGLRKLVDTLVQFVEAQNADLGTMYRETAESLFTLTSVVNEEKVKALVSLGLLKAEELEKMYDDKSIRSLYIMKSKEK